MIPSLEMTISMVSIPDMLLARVDWGRLILIEGVRIWLTVTIKIMSNTRLTSNKGMTLICARLWTSSLALCRKDMRASLFFSWKRNEQELGKIFGGYNDLLDCPDKIIVRRGGRYGDE